MIFERTMTLSIHIQRSTRMMRSLLALTLGIFSLVVSAQRVATYPLEKNADLELFHETNPNYSFQPIQKYKFGSRDTLELPFFDDFTRTNRYPDSTKWLNNQVYVNNGFGEFPRSYNVATFDGLDATGFPYRGTINKDLSVAGDSLISQPINLSFDKNGVAYTLADSIVLSFDYQPNGLGYHLNGEDSLRLWFKRKSGTWSQVWSVGGSPSSKPFKQVILALDNTTYLDTSFQFMFTTFTRQVGNANHWNIDHVYLDESRSVTEKTYRDFAIQYTPSSFLKEYQSMPYEHFKTDPARFIEDSVRLTIFNSFATAQNLNPRHEATANGQFVINTAFGSQANNILPNNQRVRGLPGFMSTSVDNVPNTGTVTIERLTQAGQVAEPTIFQNNNTLTHTQEMRDYYAYDDGSAERGFGFDQNTNPSNLEGEIAYGFDVVQRDTLFAIATYFNQAVFDVSRNRFRYRIWKSLKGVDAAVEDVLIYESEDQTATYSVANSERTFTPYEMDTVLVLDPGKYYIGWWQQSMYNLNVGWDMNYRDKTFQTVKNPNLYVGVLGSWSNSVPEGTLMMRPHFGSKRELYASVHKLAKKENRPRLYPNPATSVVYLGKIYAEVYVVDVLGSVRLQEKNCDKVSVSDLPSGNYLVRLIDDTGQQFTSRLVKIQ